MKAYIVLVFMAISLSQSSCKKFLQVNEPIDQTTKSIVYTDSSAAKSALMGLYSSLNDNITLRPLCGNISIQPGLSSDEIYRTSTHAYYTEYEKNAVSPSNQYNANNWSYMYKAVYHANAIVEGVSTSSFSQNFKEQLIGESKFLRAFVYFYLTGYYGDIPLVLDTDYEKNARLGKTSKEQVYNQIINDLESARQLLKGKSTTSDGNLRATYWAATALLARVYLYNQNYDAVIAMASEVINSATFQLESVANVFLIASKETILQFDLYQNQNTAEGSAFIPSASATVKPNFCLSPSLINLFEPSDTRRSNWVGVKTISAQPYYYPYKYKVTGSVTPKKENSVALRLAEQFLIRAEAYCQKNNLTDAVKDVDKIRSRSGLPLLSVLSPHLSQSELLEKIHKESQIEFFAEWGHRWFNLIRTRRINQVLSVTKLNWKETAALFPIPQGVLLTSPSLTQNPGY